nr:uncharacterized protein LOC125632943 [Caretta caretta]XP_048697846.1 uncharacterized protein LOC125632943 [Caretta caretta]XP_048697847.1 uncharacterized protein LOC125632943 [Caretta caretta]XP_048697848.1 uncharacterized protein LOC125632943 [Caretta caretta]XP_048697849.1 uncharacterized protein LOC125632943 [Caretta caretta]XP_048697851.1 uncharacterized protein LOC125632943 [Caretta caretta]
MAACAFDGAANFSGRHGGVQALLREKCNPVLSYTHGRGHLLQLAQVRTAKSSKDIKKAINLMSSLYSFFSKSPKRLNILENIEDTLGLKFKLVQPGKTRWLSHERSLAVVLKVLQPLLLALESIYQRGMDLSSEAGGLLLILHSEKTIAILSLLSLLLKPLGSLNNAIQASATTVVDLCPAREATFGSIRELSIEKVLEEAKTSVQKLTNEGICTESLSEEDKKCLLRQLKKYTALILKNLQQRLLDSTHHLRSFYRSLSYKTLTAEWSEARPAMGLPCAQDKIENSNTEWNIIRRMNEDLTSTSFLSSLVARPNLCALFPGMKEVGIHLLLLPVTTATAERSFSSLTRILCSERSRLLPDPVNELVSVSIEEMEVPDPWEATKDERMAFKKFINRVVQNYNKKPRRM